MKQLESRINSSFKILMILFTMILSSGTFPKQASAQESYVSLQLFYDELSPYGQWIDYRNYGYVWLPDEGEDFVPYSTAGHWIYTDYGWTWVSDYEWGWAPFHYGRWDYDNYYGWLWVPDVEWGPSWVIWRSFDGYYGWEPMQPGISLSISFGRQYNSQYDHWIFVRDRDIERPDINRYYVNRSDHDRIIRNSVVINNTYIDNSRHTTYVAGPRREDVQRATGRNLTPVAIRENNRPGQEMRNGQLRIYRPQMKKVNDRGQKPVPSRVVNVSDVKRPSERNATNKSQNMNPSNNNRREQQPNTVIPKINNENNAKPVQKEKVNPSNNNRPERQINNQQNTNGNKVQPVQRERVNPSNNNRPERQINNQQNNNENKVQPVQRERVNPSNNNRHERQMNNENRQNVQPSQTQKANPSENKRVLRNSRSQNNKVQSSQQKNVNTPGNNRNGQSKEDKAEKDKK